MSNAEVITRRLHVGGLKSDITAAHIRDRFSHFGKVQNVEELQPDALGNPRPFTFLTLETTSAQLKRCLNTMSGAHWRGALLRISDAKPQYNVKIHALNNTTPEEKAKEAEKKRKRVLRRRGEGVGREAQDMKLVSASRAAKIPFWIVIDAQDGRKRMVRPICVRPDRPIGVLEGKNNARRRPAQRTYRKVINPLQWGSQLNVFSSSDDTDMRQEGEWEYENFDFKEELNGSNDHKMALGIWRKTVNGEIVDEEVVRGKRRKIEGDEYNFDFGYGLDEIGSVNSSPLFGSRPLEQRETSPLFSPHHEKAQASRINEPGAPHEEDLNATQLVSSPLFAAHKTLLDEVEKENSLSGIGSTLSSSPLFAVRKPTDRSLSPSPSITRALTPAQFTPVAITPSLPPSSQSPAAPLKHISTPPLPSIPFHLISQARSEKSAALGVLSSLLNGIDDSPKGAKLDRNVWKGFTEDEDSDVEIGRGREKKKQEVPGLAKVTIEEEVQVDEPEIQSTFEAENDGESSASSGFVNSSETSHEDNSPSGSDDKMNVDSPNEQEDGDEINEESTNDGSESDGGDESGGSDDNSSDDSDDSESDDSESDDSESDDSESDDSESDDSDSDTDKHSSDSDNDSCASSNSPPPPSASYPSNTPQPNPSNLKSLFAPSVPSDSLLPGGSLQNKNGFSLLATLGGDIELDETLDIPIPTINTQQPTEQELEPHPLIEGGRGKVKFDVAGAPGQPLFFALPTEKDAAERSRGKKGESQNPYNELHFGIPFTNHHAQNYHAEEETTPLPGFWRQPKETDAAMREIWEKEKGELTQGWKRRFREAKKMKRRKGGDDFA
ncbi:uncharacterized protein L203_102355 [Cryptococcus depauperatus CBS 7841]|uniref:RRM domain-containing protein n=1 Tax=Cryptococcus depauperatus CBS 7841 TaxID=1295531 RepID=A0AAJ8M0L4_9TREE